MADIIRAALLVFFAKVYTFTPWQVIICFKESGIGISVLVTDRHPQISCIMKKDFLSINHQYDIWHLSKSLLKKLKIAASKKDCEELGLWRQSIINHLWWSAETCSGSVVNLKV